MRVAILFLSSLGLAGCDSPSPSMWGVDAVRIDVDGAMFNVRAKEDRAEAIRTGWDGRIRRAAMVERGVTAIERVTGCTVKPRSVKGDANIVKAALDCPGAP